MKKHNFTTLLELRDEILKQNAEKEKEWARCTTALRQVVSKKFELLHEDTPPQARTRAKNEILAF